MVVSIKYMNMNSTCFFFLLEKEMATHSGTLAWKIPWVEKPGRLQSMGSQRVGHDWATSLHFTSFYRTTEITHVSHFFSIRQYCSDCTLANTKQTMEKGKHGFRVPLLHLWALRTWHIKVSTSYGNGENFIK